jgi:polysaccharide export outer membrane protein
MNFRRHLIIALAILTATVLVAQSNRVSDYTIGAKDLLAINVFEVPELNITVRVTENGDITLPLLGTIKAGGLTRFQLEKKMAALLERSYLKNAQVTVFIKEYQSKKVSVIGAVKNPGNYDLIGKQSLLQLISMAGGLTEGAAGRIIVIRQYKNGKNASLKIDLDDLLMNGNADLNIPLSPGDIVNIPVERTSDVYVFGQVNNPGYIKVKSSSDMTILKVIAQAGGFTDRARRGSVLVKRKEKGKELKIKVNVKKILRGKQTDFIILPNDIVFVPESVL